MRDGLTFQEKLSDISTRLCEASSLMQVVCIATAAMTECPESMLDEFRVSISPALDAVNRSLSEIWVDVEVMEHEHKKSAPAPTADQSTRD